MLSSPRLAGGGLEQFHGVAGPVLPGHPDPGGGTDAVQRLREDVVTETDQRDQFQAIAPQVENGLYLVPKVIE